ALTWRVESAAIPYLVASGALELVYFALLAAAYRRYELSLVYPVARGLAPVLALVFVVAVGGSRPAALGMAGVLVVSAGVRLVLLALRLASAPAVSAVRETSVVIATALAAVFLHERVSRGRLAGSILVAAGVAMLALS